jgi:putative exosortase-associated protein (TIGR04073 family)
MGALLAGMAAPVWADEGSPTYMQGALRKLGRGAANAVSCPLELIRTPELVGRKDGYPAALTVGILQGAWNGVVRGVVGVTEVVTFFVEFPKQDFAPIVQPEFIYAHGNWAE